MLGLSNQLALIGSIAAAVAAAAVAVFSYRGWLVNAFLDYRRAHLRYVEELLAGLLSDTTAEQFWTRQLIFAGVGFVVFALLGGGGLAAFIGAALGYFLPLLKLRNDVDTRREKFEGQLEDALISMSNTLRTSPTMLHAVDLVKEALPAPASEEFALVAQDAELHSMEHALERLGNRMKSQDLNVALAAIKVSNDVGANLSEMLYAIATTLREIKRLQGLIESKTAEGKMQARVMGALPVLLGVALFFINPKMITPMFTTNLGLLILAAVILFEVVGIYLIQRLSTLDF